LFKKDSGTVGRLGLLSRSSHAEDFENNPCRISP